MIPTDERVPDVEVWLGTKERVRTAELAARGPYLLLFYLYDWSST